MKRWVITGLGLGYAPVASGTFGSAGAAAIAAVLWLVLHMDGGHPRLLDIILAVLTLLASVACITWGPWAVTEFGANARKKGDPGQVVIDEYAGQWLSLIALPMPTFTSMLIVFAVQFLLFRVFDILKLPPGRQFEKLPAGWGILTDDLAAGVYANIVGQVLFRVLWNHWGI